MSKKEKIIFVEDGVEKEIFEDEDISEKGIRFVNMVESRRHKSKITSKIIAVTPIIATLVFLCLGFLGNLWHPGWVVFLSIPLVPTVVKMFEKKFRKGVVGVIFILVVIAYLLLGTIWNLWHPGWLVFFLIPISSILIGK